MYLAIIILPLLGSIVSGFFGRKIGVSGAQMITCTAVVTTTILAVLAFFEVGLNNIPVSIEVFRWIDSESLNVSWGLHFDSLTVSMLIPVLIVSSLVHIYSIGYMSHDPHNQRFFSYLSLFTTMMVILVTAHNYLLMFVGWEGSQIQIICPKWLIQSYDGVLNIMLLVHTNVSLHIDNTSVSTFSNIIKPDLLHSQYHLLNMPILKLTIPACDSIHNYSSLKEVFQVKKIFLI